MISIENSVFFWQGLGRLLKFIDQIIFDNFNETLHSEKDCGL